jgi:DNA-binding transcriptional regulator GbsR (MarR family)
MAQVHALLLVSDELLSTEDVMEKLQISRGNANINVRALIDWGLIDRTNVKGDRKEYFIAEKDIWKIATLIVNERRKREVEPILKALKQVKDIDAKSGDKKEIKQFTDFIESLEKFTGTIDGVFEKFCRADQSWFTGTILKLFK